MPVDGQSRSYTLGPIQVNRPYQMIAIDADAPDISNEWVEIDYALVDRKTQASYDAYGIAERYSGRDSDGSWSEGSRDTTVKIAAVPAGIYDLVVDVSGSKWQGGSSQIQTPAWGGPATRELKLQVRSGTIFPSNLLVAIIALLLPLLWIAWRHIKFEHARQSESDAGATGLAAMMNSSDDEEED